MKRRSFLQWCLVVLGVSTAGVSAVKATEEVSGAATKHAKPIWRRSPRTPNDPQSWDTLKAAHTCNFRGYELVAFKNIVTWHTLGEPSRVDILQMERHLNGIELKTNDVCKELFFSKASYLTDDCVFWFGEREVWKIEYIGGEQVFQVAFFAKATHAEKLTGVLRCVIEEVPKLKSPRRMSGDK